MKYSIFLRLLTFFIFLTTTGYGAINLSKYLKADLTKFEERESLLSDIENLQATQKDKLTITMFNRFISILSNIGYEKELTSQEKTELLHHVKIVQKKNLISTNYLKEIQSITEKLFSIPKKDFILKPETPKPQQQKYSGYSTNWQNNVSFTNDPRVVFLKNKFKTDCTNNWDQMMNFTNNKEVKSNQSQEYYNKLINETDEFYRIKSEEILGTKYQVEKRLKEIESELKNTYSYEYSKISQEALSVSSENARYYTKCLNGYATWKNTLINKIRSCSMKSTYSQRKQQEKVASLLNDPRIIVLKLSLKRNYEENLQSLKNFLITEDIKSNKPTEYYRNLTKKVFNFYDTKTQEFYNFQRQAKRDLDKIETEIKRKNHYSGCIKISRESLHISREISDYQAKYLAKSQEYRDSIIRTIKFFSGNSNNPSDKKNKTNVDKDRTLRIIATAGLLATPAVIILTYLYCKAKQKECDNDLEIISKLKNLTEEEIEELHKERQSFNQKYFPNWLKDMLNMSLDWSFYT